MSSVIFLQYFENQKSAGIPRDAVRKAFGSSLQEPESDYWSLPYDAGNACTIFLEPFDADTVHQLTVERSCEDARLWDYLLAVLALGNAIMYSPRSSTPVIVDEGAIQHIPCALLGALGIPVVVRNAQEIRAVFVPSIA